MQDQDCVGKFIEFNINFADAASLAKGEAKELSFHGDVWLVKCYPHGATGDDGFGEYLSIHLQNKRTDRGGRLLLKVMVLGRGAGAATPASASGHPPVIHGVYRRVIDYPKHLAQLPLTRIFQTSELAKHCTVCGHVTIVCSLVLLRPSPIPFPPSTFASDFSSLVVQNRYGEPDITVVFPDGKSVGVNRNVLEARCSALKDALEHAAGQQNSTAVEAKPEDGAAGQQNTTAVEAKPEDGGGPMEVSDESPNIITLVGGEEETATTLGGGDEAETATTRTKRVEATGHITVDAPSGLLPWTFYALLLYIYCDRLPRDTECCGAPATVDRLRDLLAAADRYGLQRLKLMCAKKLWEDMSAETVSRTLWVAHEHNCKELKSACMDFITVAANSDDVMRTEDFHWLANKSPTIMIELMQRNKKTYL